MWHSIIKEIKLQFISVSWKMHLELVLEYLCKAAIPHHLASFFPKFLLFETMLPSAKNNAWLHLSHRPASHPVARPRRPSPVFPSLPMHVLHLHLPQSAQPRSHPSPLAEIFLIPAGRSRFFGWRRRVVPCTGSRGGRAALCSRQENIQGALKDRDWNTFSKIIGGFLDACN